MIILWRLRTRGSRVICLGGNLSVVFLFAYKSVVAVQMFSGGTAGGAVIVFRTVVGYPNRNGRFKKKINANKR